MLSVSSLPDHSICSNSDSSIQEAYVDHQYQRALDLCIIYLDGVEDGSIKLEGNGSARERECYDIALRCCNKLAAVRETLGPKLVERSQHLWKAHYTIGISAADVYLSIRRPQGVYMSCMSTASPNMID